MLTLLTHSGGDQYISSRFDINMERDLVDYLSVSSIKSNSDGQRGSFIFNYDGRMRHYTYITLVNRPAND